MSVSVAPRRMASPARLAIALLCALSFLVLTPQPAQAGVLTGVHHDPTGYDELYSTTPTERAPRDPMAGQAVTVRATTWPISSGQSVWITWTKNGVGQTPIGASWDYNSGNNTYWQLGMGSCQ